MRRVDSESRARNMRKTYYLLNRDGFDVQAAGLSIDCSNCCSKGCLVLCIPISRSEIENMENKPVLVKRPTIICPIINLPKRDTS